MKKLLTATILVCAAGLTVAAQRPAAPRAESSQRAPAAKSAARVREAQPTRPPLVAVTPAQRAKLDRKAQAAAARPFGQPDLAEEFYVNSRTGPIITRGANPTRGTRTLNPSMYLPAVQQMRDMPRYSSGLRRELPSAASSSGPAGDRFDPSAAVPGAALGTWSNLGPANQGGRTRALIIDPGNPNVMYAGGVAGGVWKSTDGGANWTPYGDQMANIGVVTLAFDPSNTNVIYAGTGEGVGNFDAIRGAGIFKSTDAGLTWSQLASTNNSSFFYSMKVMVSPRNTQRLWAATRAGIFRSLDAGGSWTPVLTGVEASNGCTDMAMQVQSATGYVFASCGRTGSQGSIYRADDSDVSSFNSILSMAGQGRSSIAVAPSNESVVYVLASQRTGGITGTGPGLGGLHGVYKSISDGNPGSFTTQRAGNVAFTTTEAKINQLLLSNPVIGLLAECGFGTTQFLNQGWYDNVIAVDPTDANVVWAGGIDLWRSDNGGIDWGTAGYWWFDKGIDPQYHHADQHGIVFHPNYNGTTNKTMFAASDGGVERIDDARAPVNTTLAQICGAPVTGGPTWVDRNTGYVTTQFYDGAVYPDGQTYFGGLQDNGTQRGNAASTNWTVLAGGDGGYVAVDTLGDTNPANDVLFLENTGNSMQRSVDGGATFRNVTVGSTGINPGGFQFIAPFTMNEGNRQQLWAGGFDIWRTTNHATTWSRATAALGTCGLGSISAIATHPLDGNRVLVGMTDGCYHYNHAALSAPSTGTWPGGATIANGVISWMAWDPQNINVAYATVSNFTSNTLLKSVDGGASWAPSMGSGPTALPQIPARSVVVNPNDSLQVFVGTDLGVFTSVDGGASWYVENTGFANVSVNSLKFDAAGATLYAFTHGRGAWKVSLSNATCEPITLGAGPLANGTLGTAYSHTFSASGGAAPYTFGVTGGALPPGLTLAANGELTGSPTAAGVYNFTVTATDDNGCPGSAGYSITVIDARVVTTTVVTFEPGPYVYRGTPFTATAVTTSTDGVLNQSTPVTYTGDCTNVTGANGCTATATFAETSSYLGSVGSASITIVKAPALVALNALTQVYTGSPLQPTSTTTPPGLAVALTGAPQTNAGSYPVTATITSPNYEGSASDTFVISKAPATVTLSAMSQPFTGTPRQPTVTTVPPGLTVILTGAPQTAVGSYPVTATVNDANYQGSVSGTFVITAAPSPLSLTATPLTISPGQGTAIFWNAGAGATNVSLTPGYPTIPAVGAVGVYPTATTTYTLTATLPGGLVATATVTVVVTGSTAPPAPTAALSAAPATIVAGQSSTLSWTTANATSVSISPGIGAVGSSGSRTVSPTTTTTYTLTATNSAGQSVVNSATVIVTPAPPAPTATLSAAPSTITAGQASTLSWATTNATTVSISPGVGVVGPSGSATVSPTTTTVYTITATSASGVTATATATVTVGTSGPGAPTATLTASPAAVAPGQGAVLSWSTTNASTRSLTPGYPSVPASGAVAVYPTTTTTYTLTATNAAGQTAVAIATVVVTGTPPPLPTASFSATPTPIVAGQSATLSWSTTNAATVSIAPGVGAVGATGTRSVSPTSTTTYTLTATNSAGQAVTATATVTVTPGTPPPTATITAVPTTITAGQSTTLNWTTTNATSVSISGVGVVGTSGSLAVNPAATTTYTITATSAAGVSTTASVTVTVTPAGPGPTATLTASPSTVTRGQGAVLSWSTTGGTTFSLTPGYPTVPGAGAVAVYPTATTTYTLTATDAAGRTTTATATVVVQ